MLSSYAFVSCLILVSFSAQCGRSLSSEIAGGTCIIGGNGRSLSENDMLVYKDSDYYFFVGGGEAEEHFVHFFGVLFLFLSVYISLFHFFLSHSIEGKGGGVWPWAIMPFCIFASGSAPLSVFSPHFSLTLFIKSDLLTVAVAPPPHVFWLSGLLYSSCYHLSHSLTNLCILKNYLPLPSFSTVDYPLTFNSQSILPTTPLSYATLSLSSCLLILFSIYIVFDKFLKLLSLQHPCSRHNSWTESLLIKPLPQPTKPNPVKKSSE